MALTMRSIEGMVLVQNKRRPTRIGQSFLKREAKLAFFCGVGEFARPPFYPGPRSLHLVPLFIQGHWFTLPPPVGT